MYMKQQVGKAERHASLVLFIGLRRLHYSQGTVSGDNTVKCATRPILSVRTIFIT